MRKVFVLLILCGLGFVFYLYVYQPYLSTFVDLYRQSGQVAALNDRIENQDVFNPPENDVLSSAQVERYVGVQQSVAAAMSGTLDSLRIKLERLQGDIHVQSGRIELSRVGDSARDLLTAVIEAKEAQVEALNQHNFSLDEYNWVRREIYRAADVPLPDRDLTDIIADMRRGRFNLDGLSSDDQAHASEVPDENRELVSGHLQTLREHVGLAFIGL